MALQPALACIIALAGFAMMDVAAAQPRADPAIELKRGVNPSHWLSQAKRYRRDAAYHTPAHMTLMREAGLDHIRLPIDPEPMWDWRNGRFIDEHLQRIEAAVDMAHEAGLAVVFDMQPEDDFKKAIQSDPQRLEQFAALWSATAKHFADRDPKKLAFELINEPQVEDPGKWAAMQKKLHAAVRAAAPHHTIVLTGARWSGVDQLVELEPLDDANVLYTFHFYEPFTFTHQGASWGPDWIKPMRRVPYPSSPELVEPAVAATDNEQSAPHVRWYGKQQWDRQKMAEQFDRAAAWAKKHGVRVYLGEFGTYRPHAPTQSRLRWLRDVREVAESHGMPWAMWDFADSFGLAKREQGGRIVVDREVAEALGLAP